MSNCSEGASKFSSEGYKISYPKDKSFKLRWRKSAKYHQIDHEIQRSRLIFYHKKCENMLGEMEGYGIHPSTGLPIMSSSHDISNSGEDSSTSLKREIEDVFGNSFNSPVGKYSILMHTNCCYVSKSM